MGLVVVAGVVAAWGGPASDRVPGPAAGAVATLADPPTPRPSPAVRASAPPRGAWRARELRRLRASRTVEGALRRAWLARRIDTQRYAEYRAGWTRAQAAARRLPGRRGVEQRAVVALAAGMARERALGSGRLAAVALTLRRNAEFWSRKPLPRAGQRFVFGRDPVVFGYEPGQGLQVHWLGTWGRANGRARFCLERPGRCPRARVRAELGRLVALGARRAGTTTSCTPSRRGRGSSTGICRRSPACTRWRA